MKFDWQPNQYGGFECVPEENIILVASPDYTRAFQPIPKRGTTWRAQVSRWDQSTHTMSRFGRDEYKTLHKTKHDAMRAAESIYMEAKGIQ